MVDREAGPLGDGGGGQGREDDAGSSPGPGGVSPRGWHSVSRSGCQDTSGILVSSFHAAGSLGGQGRGRCPGPEARAFLPLGGPCHLLLRHTHPAGAAPRGPQEAARCAVVSAPGFNSRLALLGSCRAAGRGALAALGRGQLQGGCNREGSPPPRWALGAAPGSEGLGPSPSSRLMRPAPASVCLSVCPSAPSSGRDPLRGPAGTRTGRRRRQPRAMRFTAGPARPGAGVLWFGSVRSGPARRAVATAPSASPQAP